MDTPQTPTPATAIEQAATSAKPIATLGRRANFVGSSASFYVFAWLLHRYAFELHLDEDDVTFVAGQLAIGLAFFFQWLTSRAVFQKLFAAAAEHTPAQ